MTPFASARQNRYHARSRSEPAPDRRVGAAFAAEPGQQTSDEETVVELESVDLETIDEGARRFLRLAATCPLAGERWASLRDLTGLSFGKYTCRAHP